MEEHLINLEYWLQFLRDELVELRRVEAERLSCERASAVALGRIAECLDPKEGPSFSQILGRLARKFGLV